MKRRIQLTSLALMVMAGCTTATTIQHPVYASTIQQVRLDERLEEWMNQATDSSQIDILIELSNPQLDLNAINQQIEKEIADGTIMKADRISRRAQLLIEEGTKVIDSFLTQNPDIAAKVKGKVEIVPAISLTATKSDIQQYMQLEGIDVIIGNDLGESGIDSTEATWTWDCVWFGNYPQKEIKNSTLLTNATYDANGYTEILGSTYKRESRDGQYYYFKCEPIKWRVLETTDDEMFLLADKSIDYRRYVDINSGDGWIRSDIHTWLNDTFYKTAFTNEKEYIVTKTIWDDLTPDQSVEDKVILLSREQAANLSYGFPASEQEKSLTRKCETTDYAKFCSYDEQDVTKLSSEWMLRDTDRVCSEEGIRFVGSVGVSGLHMPKFGVRPAVYVKKDAVDKYVHDAGTVNTEGTGKEEMAPDNKKVTLEDAQTVLKCALKINATQSGDVELLDQNGDNQLALVDAQKVLKKALKIGE